ncbi:MAG: hypothetical protein BKP49_02800 [Treponema sp. CETP13]|nr:MAG: hypothetical protein BKP49_02800 [Treponema sp. CETP13]
MSNQFVNKMKDYLDKGVEVSKDTLDKAGDAVQKLGNSSITKVEQLQMEQKLKQKYLEFGKQCYELMKNDENLAVLSTNSSLNSSFEAINELKTKLDSV